MPENLGQAIALTAKPDSVTPYILQGLRQRRLEENQALENARKERQKNLAEQEQYKQSIDKWVLKNESGIGRVHQDTVRTKAAKLFDVMQGIRSANPNGYNYRNNREFQNALYDLQTEYDRAQQSTAQFTKDLNLLNNDKGINLQTKTVILPDGKKTTLLDAWQKGDPSEWDATLKSIHGTSYGGEYYTTGLLDNKVKTEDWRKLKNAHVDQTRQGKVVTEQGAEFLPQTNLQTRWEDYKNSPAFGFEMADYDVRFPNLEESQKQQLAFEDYKSVIGQKAAPLKKETEKAEELAISDIKKDVPINIYVPKKGKQVEYTASYGVTLPSNVTLNIPVSKNVMNRATGEPLDKTGQMNISGGQLVSRPYTKEGKTFVKAMLHTTARIGDENIDVEVPLEEIRGQKILEKNKAVIDEFQRLTNSLQIKGEKVEAPKEKTRKKFNPATGKIE